MKQDEYLKDLDKAIDVISRNISGADHISFFHEIAMSHTDLFRKYLYSEIEKEHIPIQIYSDMADMAEVFLRFPNNTKSQLFIMGFRGAIRDALDIPSSHRSVSSKKI